MYKTVRHGENSLQYTILPQQDDSAAMTANSSVCGRSSTSVRRRSRRGRTATILILTLILACGVVGAAVLVHVLISTNLVSLPSALQRLGSNNNGDHHGEHHSYHSAVQKNKTTAVHQSTTPLLSVVSEDVATSSVKFDQGSTSVSPTTSPQDVTATTKPPVQVVASTEGAGSTVTAQQQAPLEVGGRLEEDVGAKEHDHVGSSKKKALDEDMRNTTTRIFVSAATGEDNSVLVLDVGRSTERPKHRSWLEPRWPFADPSSYLHWAVSTFDVFPYLAMKMEAVCTYETFVYFFKSTRRCNLEGQY